MQNPLNASIDILSTYHCELFKGHTVAVTGGGSGIGFSIARACGKLGARVVIAARDEERLGNAAKILDREGIDVTAVPVNIRDESSVNELFEILNEQKITVDILVNNAGGQFAANALELSAKGFRAVLDLNLQGTFQMCKAFANHVIEDGRPGNIINIVLCQESGVPGMAHAGAARSGVVNLTRTLAWEWADRGIRVNAIAPGIIKTSALEQYDPEITQAGIDKLLIKRLGEPEEVASAVVFLASPAASFITGILLPLDGGEHLTGATPQL